jgi:protein involved in polysaccharide export with SLBB domain
MTGKGSPVQEIDKMLNRTKIVLNLAVTVAVIACAHSVVHAQSPSQITMSDDGRPRAAGAVDSRPLNPAIESSPSAEMAIQAQINSAYQSFFNSYRLGAGDVVAIYVDKHPDDSVLKAVVSPVGQIYHPLLGNVPVAGKTLSLLQDYFAASLSEFIKDPRVTISLLEANSAKIGVLGDVHTPGVLVMARPMKVLDALSAAGGILDTGSASRVSLLRQYEDGRVQMLSVNVKKILQGKASPEENVYLRAGDTVIVHGNLFKKLTRISSLVGVTTFITFLTRGGR